MPEKMLGKIKNNILPQWKVCFISALLMGLVAHLYKITNWLPNWDSLVFRYDAQNMIGLGRWFLPVVCAPSSFYDLPFIAGFLAILFYALGAVCVCKMFDVQKKITAALIGALVATFPPVASALMYNYVADGYAIAFFISCIAAMVLAQDKPKIRVAAILIALSAGIYQAFITVTILLLLLHLITELLYKNSDFKTLVLKCVKYLIAGVLGMVLYYLVLTVLIKITKADLLDYQGFGSATSMGGSDLRAALYTIKQSFLGYFFDFSDGWTLFSVLNIILLVLTVVLYLTDAIRSKIGLLKTLLLCVLAVLLPVSASVLSFLNSSIDYHNLMKMGFFVFYLFLILQYEKTDFAKEKYNTAKCWTILVLTVVLIFNQVIIANISYHKLNMAYEKSYGTLIRIADRIEQTKGSENCDSVLVIGHLEESKAYSALVSLDMTGTTDGYILRADDEVVGQSVLCSALNDYCGKQYTFLAGEEKQALLKKIEQENLGNWPAKDSISVTDNVIIIKLGDETVK